FGEAGGQVAGRPATLLFVDEARAHFAAQVGGFVLDKVITDARAGRDAVFDVGHGIMRHFQSAVAKDAVRVEPVILSEGADRFVILYAIVFTVGCGRPEVYLVAVPLFGRQEAGGEGDRIAVSTS